MAEPESGVLPLHHKAIYQNFKTFVSATRQFLRSLGVSSPFDDAKLVLFFDMTKFFGNFF